MSSSSEIMHYDEPGDRAFVFLNGRLLDWCAMAKSGPNGYAFVFQTFEKTNGSFAPMHTKAIDCHESWGFKKYARIAHPNSLVFGLVRGFIEIKDAEVYE